MKLEYGNNERCNNKSYSVYTYVKKIKLTE